ncbi:hypothetical protein POTOM_016126 [Populus tomentosa]|uniref:Poly [ADP-ribose] polymerase n=1 Tax=Populus tomentosa TaxID=118781 RepID=A0A8X8A142_POPTO|nr:hypothetical protein POTOM_016126 [Populus tomentosa]
MKLHNVSVTVFYNHLTTAQAVEGTILDKWQVITPLDTHATILAGQIMRINEVYKVCLPMHGYRGLVLKLGSGFELCIERIQKKDEDRHEEEERLYDSSRKTLLSVGVQERERGGSTKLADKIIEKQEPQPMEADDVSDLFVEGKGTPWDKQVPEAPKSISAELKLYGKRGVYKDTKLQERGGRILEKDGIVNLHLYYKKGKVGHDPNAEERLEEWENAIKEFGRLFEELTGNEFEPWEREKKFEKKRLSFYPIDMGAAAFETVRDINVASRLIGDMSGSTLDDPLSDRYKKLGCSVSALEKDSDDYKRIDYGVSVENVFPVEPSACPPLVEIKKLPNKVLLWCGKISVLIDSDILFSRRLLPGLFTLKGTRSSNMLRHLQKGFLPSVCSLPVPGYLFGKAIVCSDAAAEAGRYAFTAVDRPEGFLALAVASLGDQVIKVESPLEDTKSLDEKKFGVKGLERKTTDESEHFLWKDDIKVPYARLIPSVHNEYAIYDPKQTSIRFFMDTAEP